MAEGDGAGELAWLPGARQVAILCRLVQQIQNPLRRGHGGLQVAEEFRRLADPFIDSAVHCSIDRDLLCANLQPRCEVLEDIPPQLDFFDAVLPIDAEMYRNKKQKTTPESAKEALTALLPVLEAQTDWTRDAIFEACKTLAESMEKKNGWLLFPLGIALSGKSRTPGGGTDLAAMMGKEETVKRVKAALEKL